MNLLKPAIASAAMLLGGVAVSAPNTADAGLQLSFGNYGYGNRYGYPGGYGYGGYGNNFGYGRNYGNGGFGWGSGFNNGYYGHRHNRGHYDYHPQSIVPHRGHYDVIPGHYDYHRGGHGHHHRH